VVSPVEEEEDPKAKKDAKKAPTSPEEGEGTGNEIKILIDTCSTNEEQKKLSLDITVVFQGEPYEDPNPPEEDAAATKKKGAKDPTEPEIRMITPEPIILEKENGREFEIQLGRNQKVVGQESVMESVKE